MSRPAPKNRPRFVSDSVGAADIADERRAGAEGVPRVLEVDGAECLVAADLERAGVLRLRRKHDLEIGRDPEPAGAIRRGFASSGGTRPRARPAARTRSTPSPASPLVMRKTAVPSTPNSTS